MRALFALIARTPGQLPLGALLTALMVLSALTEGFGLLLLAPMLGALAGAEAGGPVFAITAGLGLPLALAPLLALFVALVVLRGLVNLARSLIAHRFQTTLVDGLRQRAWRALLDCDWRELLAMRQSDNASLLIGNLDRVAAGVQLLLGAVAALVTLAALGLAALAYSPGLAAGAAIAGGLVLLAYRGLRSRAADLGEQLGQAVDTVYLRMNEGLSALRTIKSLGGEDQAEHDTVTGFAGLARSHRSYLLGLGLGQLALQAGGALTLALLVWLAVSRWDTGIATILPLVALFARALPLLGALQEGMQHWAHARPALDSALALIARAEAAREPEAAPGPAPVLGTALRLDGVAVHYSGQSGPALDGIDLAIPAGSIIALSGPSGAGKSTLADLLGGLLSPDTGAILIDRNLLDPASRRAWRRQVAYVEQDPALFAATVRENLLWAAPAASEARLRAALSDAAADFVDQLPQGLDTPLGDGGRRLSGGERQRLMLARALLREPQLLILDEATSALDAANESAVASAVERLRGRMTIVIISHRGGLLDLADLVVTLDRGRIAGIAPETASLRNFAKFTDYSATES